MRGFGVCGRAWRWDMRTCWRPGCARPRVGACGRCLRAVWPEGEVGSGSREAVPQPLSVPGTEKGVAIAHPSKCFREYVVITARMRV